ncbi:MAG: hypothetical protein M0Z49_07855 [Chloroflexi bacterium]|nr:hypothetical protein [Chloroflexota bacterium]
MTSKRTRLLAGMILGGSLLLGSTGLVLAQGPTATPTATPPAPAGDPGGMMNGQAGGMMNGQAGGMMNGQAGGMMNGQAGGMMNGQAMDTKGMATAHAAMQQAGACSRTLMNSVRGGTPGR